MEGGREGGREGVWGTVPGHCTWDILAHQGRERQGVDNERDGIQ